jgi:pimeloyl-ACP methyl ester carboxylesterase
MMKRRDFFKSAVIPGILVGTNYQGLRCLGSPDSPDSTSREQNQEGKRASTPNVSKQFGSERLDFMVDDCRAFLIRPKHDAPARSKPWLWYAPAFMGKHPSNPSVNPTQCIHPTDADTPVMSDRKDRTTNVWLFTRLLSHGFHICGIEVGESYGNPWSRQRLTEFYHYLLKNYRLSPKACLYPQSRGGLMLYNWAVEYPDWVQCIGGNQPVCDLRSYPGMEKACAAYGMSVSGLREHLEEHNPIDRLVPLAARRVPILHIHGDEDTVVPLEANTMELARRYKAAGGEMQVIVAKGVRHGNWPELFEEPRMLEFLLSQASVEKPIGGS